MGQETSMHQNNFASLHPILISYDVHTWYIPERTVIKNTSTGMTLVMHNQFIQKVHPPRKEVPLLNIIIKTNLYGKKMSYFKVLILTFLYVSQ